MRKIEQAHSPPVHYSYACRPSTWHPAVWSSNGPETALQQDDVLSAAVAELHVSLSRSDRIERPQARRGHVAAALCAAAEKVLLAHDLDAGGLRESLAPLVRQIDVWYSVLDSAEATKRSCVAASEYLGALLRTRCKDRR